MRSYVRGKLALGNVLSVTKVCCQDLKDGYKRGTTKKPPTVSLQKGSKVALKKSMIYLAHFGLTSGETIRDNPSFFELAG